MVIICGPFLGKTKNGSGKNDADDDADDVSEERYEEANPLGVFFYYSCDVATHPYTAPGPSPNYGEDYPRPQQHDKGTGQEAHIIGSGTKS